MDGKNLAFGVAVTAAIVGGVFLFRSGILDDPVPAPAQPVAQVAPAPAAPAAEAPLHYPVEAPAGTGPLAAADLPAALMELLGRQAVTTFLQIDEFPRRFVATVDNLGRAHAPSRLWPVHPTAGRFTAEETAQGTVIAIDNSARYTPIVLLAEKIDTAAAVKLYQRMYPSLQAAYEELGFPRRYFNDRLVQVIDLLLATPPAPQAPELRLTEVKGPVPSVRPWVRYEYVDPALESLSSGQKIMLRVGPVNQRRLKAKLAEFRKQLTAAAAPGSR